MHKTIHSTHIQIKTQSYNIWKSVSTYRMWQFQNMQLLQLHSLSLFHWNDKIFTYNQPSEIQWLQFATIHNQKHHLEGNTIPAGCKAKCCAPWVELITIWIVILRSIWHKVCVRLFTFWKNSISNLRIFWRHLPTELCNGENSVQVDA